MRYVQQIFLEIIFIMLLWKKNHYVFVVKSIA